MKTLAIHTYALHIHCAYEKRNFHGDIIVKCLALVQYKLEIDVLILGIL